ncbi:J domain-containing protein [Vulcanococcus sp.]|uniref:J domain-containing protein n=1 Tax=Vulcanococcus sp. TaxID=2856995 RepID=UPI003F69779F
MGFDPRQWPAGPRSSRPITGNVDALLEENAALKREVLRLRRLLDRYECLERDPRANTRTVWVTPEQVQQWARQLTQQPGWSSLRAGDAAHGLQGLLDQLNRASFLPQLSLEERLDRLAPGLGHDLQAALSALRGKQLLAVMAAFALYGVSAREWLDDDPRRVVADLRQRCTSERRTRSDRRRTDRDTSGAEAWNDPSRAEAYRQLGLTWGATREAIKQAHRRLVKQHHPDMGGDAAVFRRVNAAYQLLIA